MEPVKPQKKKILLQCFDLLEHILIFIEVFFFFLILSNIHHLSYTAQYRLFFQMSTLNAVWRVSNVSKALLALFPSNNKQICYWVQKCRIEWYSKAIYIRVHKQINFFLDLCHKEIEMLWSNINYLVFFSKQRHN